MSMCMIYNGCMVAPILATKLYIPPLLGPALCPRPRLIERLNEGVGGGTQTNAHLRFRRLWQDYPAQ